MKVRTKLTEVNEEQIFRRTYSGSLPGEDRRPRTKQRWTSC